MGKRIVIALGGNALGSNLPEQMIAVKQTAKAIVDLIEEGHEVIIAHGNGPQVGMIQKAMAELTRSEPEKYIPCPLSVCVAMSQGYIGYDLQNALREELLDRGIQKGVATVLTQVEVDPNDEAFHNPTKPIGAFMTKEEADKMVAERGYNVIEDAGRGYRRVVASPRPQSIIEIQSIRDMVDFLAPGGRICIITFHSLEDRIVKNAFRRNENPCTCPPEFPVCVCGKKPRVRLVTRKPIVSGAAELEENSRARSAKLRVVEKCDPFDI